MFLIPLSQVWFISKALRLLYFSLETHGSYIVEKLGDHKVYILILYTIKLTAYLNCYVVGDRQMYKIL